MSRHKWYSDWLGVGTKMEGGQCGMGMGGEGMGVETMWGHFFKKRYKFIGK